jgi:hypothetical protein
MKTRSGTQYETKQKLFKIVKTSGITKTNKTDTLNNNIIGHVKITSTEKTKTEDNPKHDEKVTKEQFKEYLRIQRSGLTNMFDAKNVLLLSCGKLKKDDVLEIMNNYDKLLQVYN